MIHGPGTGAALAPGMQARLRGDEHFSHLVLAMPSSALAQKLSALLGAPAHPPLQLSSIATGRPDRLATLLRLALFHAEELDRAAGQLPDLLREEVEQALMIGYLLASQHNYTRLLSASERGATPRQVRMATDYIEEHWDAPIRIEDLVALTQTSARNLFRLFRKTHGASPMEYARGVRLRHARSMLLEPSPLFTVTGVGLLCGFSNLGYFARAYYKSFGELPSQTAQRRPR